jgi:hypothetical protein
MTQIEKAELLYALRGEEVHAKLVAHFAFEDAVEARVLKEMKELDWIRQTVHRAHHAGPLNECRVNTCDAAMKIIGVRSPLFNFVTAPTIHNNPDCYHHGASRREGESCARCDSP